MSASPERILVIEDERDLREGLRHNLEVDGYEVGVAATGRQGLERLTSETWALVILDLMLPELSGLHVLEAMRERDKATPVIILSAKGQDHDRVSGLELGADDYVTKPFGLAELMARIRAVLRRTSAAVSNGPSVHEFPGLRVDFKRFAVYRDGHEHQLSRYEAEILRMLVSRQRQVVTRNELLRTVWGYVHLPTTRTVDNHIARLRKKVERVPDQPRFVITVHGIGYRFEPDGGRP